MDEGYARMAGFLLYVGSGDSAAVVSRLMQLQQQDPSKFLHSLSLELFEDNEPLESRRLAGILLKNSLDDKDATPTWVSIDNSIKNEIKALLLKTLRSSDSVAGHAAAQVIGKIASIDIPRMEWPDLIISLLGNMTQQDSPASLKKATMESLGYVCEVISPNDLPQTEVDSVFRAVLQGMQVSETDAVCRAAATTLYNALPFARTHFEKEKERQLIMKIVCDTARAEDANIRKTAYECLVVIASLYYEFLEPYMPTIFWVMSDAFEERNDELVLNQAIEFWKSICDAEIKLRDINSPHYGLIEQAMPILVPMLLSTLLDQDKEGVWTPLIAGGTCLGLVARTVGDSIIQYVIPFVQICLFEGNATSRGAGAYALNSILEVFSVERLFPGDTIILQLLLIAMGDENREVKKATSWTISRIFELFHSSTTKFSVISPRNINGTVQVLLESIKDSEDVAKNGCRAIYYLAQRYEGPQSGSSVLTPCLAKIITSLIETAERTDRKVSDLQSAVYETLNEVVMTSNLSGSSQTLKDQLTVVMSKLDETLELHILSPVDREKQGDLLAFLCSVLHVFIRKLSSTEETKPSISQVADPMMNLLLRVFESTSSTAQKEAMLATGALTYATGPDFLKYISQFWNYLERGLQNHEEYQAYSTSVGVVRNICKILDGETLPHCNEIMTLLFDGLASSDLHMSVKPDIVLCIGDVALAIGEQFETYASDAMLKMQVAVKVCDEIDVNDKEMGEYGNQLKTSLTEAYKGISKGLKNPKAKLPNTSNLLDFLNSLQSAYVLDMVELSKEGME